MVIRPTDRIAQLLDRDERLLEVLVTASSHFERLRNPGLRRIMARLVTVEQAARIANMDVQALVDRLNESTAGRATSDSESRADGAEGHRLEISQTPGPPNPRRFGTEQIVELDVREDLRNGREPFSRIMAAKETLPEHAVLCLRAIFEPVPLYGVMELHGFGHWAEQLAEDDWRVWFYRQSESPKETPTETPSANNEAPTLSAATHRDVPRSTGEHESTAALEGDPPVVILDVRGLEPPEPLVRTLAALETLPQGVTLMQINVRKPEFLLPQLEALSYEFDVRPQGKDLVHTFIRRRGELQGA